MIARLVCWWKGHTYFEIGDFNVCRRCGDRYQRLVLLRRTR